MYAGPDAARPQVRRAKKSQGLRSRTPNFWASIMQGEGLFRVTLATDAPIAVEMHLEDFYPEVVGHNPHQTKVVVSGLRTLEVPLREFRQVPGVGVAAPLKSVLSNISNLRIEVRQPGFAGQFRIHKLEVCDFL